MPRGSRTPLVPSSAVSRPRTRRAHRTWPQRLLITTNVVLVLACLGAAAGLSKIRSTIENVPVVDIGSSLTPAPELSEPRNVLIIGTDSAAGLDSEDPAAEGREQLGQLADVIMILRLDPRDGSAKLLSIPRDSRVAVAPGNGMDRINTAINGADGPQNLVRTIKRNFGISIDNYVEVDFRSFRDLVEVLGGVPVYFATPVRDRNSGLYIDEPGCRMLDPAQALAYARSRHFEYQVDGRWRTDGSGDLGRITRQQDFIKRSLRRASDKGIRNPSTAVGVVNAAVASVRMDDTLDVGTILTLVGEFQSFNPDSLQSQQIPTFSDPRGGVAYQTIDWEAAEPLLEQFRSVDPGAALTPAGVIVDVEGDEDEMERLDAIADELDAVGFDAEAFEDRAVDETAITYGPRGRDAALLLAAQLETLPQMELDEDISGYRVVLTVGEDFGGVRADALPLDQLPPDLVPPTSEPTTTLPDGAAPDSTTPDPSTPDATTPDSTDPGSTTTTSVPGVVPTDPERAATCR
jgi:polyisoprenyl-teichoic acid--peptidoglycan teichoic acid transferase